METRTPEAPWPVGVQLVQEKMYRDGKLCVPKDRTAPLLLAFHVEKGHPGQKRLVAAATTQFPFEPAL